MIVSISPFEWLIIIAIAFMFVLDVIQMLQIARLSGESTKFGRLLRKVRRAEKAKSGVPDA